MPRIWSDHKAMAASPPSPDWGKRELLRAVEQDDPSAILRVVEFGYSLDAILVDSDSALHIASAKGCKLACQVLLNNRVSVNLREGKNGFTPLHYAAGEGHPEIVQMLLAHGADPRAKDLHGYPPGAWAKDNTRALLEPHKIEHSAAEPTEPSRADNSHWSGFTQKQEAAMNRLERRRIELLETEDEVSRNLQRLALVLKALTTIAPWNSSETYFKPLRETRQALHGVYKVHVHVRWLAAESLAELEGMARLFPPPIVSHLISWHSQYEASACALLERLREKPAPPMPPGLTADQATELLVRPTQRLMRYQLFVEGMIEDATLLPEEDQRVLPGLRGALQAAKDMVHAVNDGKREREQLQRLDRILSQVVSVPEGVALRKRNRQLLLEQDDLMQRDKQGYRKLVVFTDAVLVLKQGMQRSHHPAPSELRFKDMISLRGFNVASCPSVIPPYAHSGQGGARERSFAFELLGRTFLGSEGAISRVVDAIRSAVVESIPRSASVLQALSPSGRNLVHVGHAQLVGRDADGNPLVLYAF